MLWIKEEKKGLSQDFWNELCSATYAAKFKLR